MMNKLNLIFALALGLSVSGPASAQSRYSDSLHFRLVPDTASWNEELAAYTINIDFEMKYDVPDELIKEIVVDIKFETAFYSFLSFTNDSTNWKAFYGLNQIDSISELGDMGVEWLLFLPVPDTSRTTGEFVRYGTFTYKVVNQSGRFEGGIRFDRTGGNDIIVFNNSAGQQFWLFDSNYTDCTPLFLGVTETPCCNSPGDANNSGTFNISDVTFVIARIFAGGPPAPCLAEADADANATLNIADVTFMIARIFAGGPAPSCVSTII